MNRRSILRVLFWGITAGGVVVILSGEQQAVSLRLWLACVVIWFATGSVRRLFEGVPLVPAQLKMPVIRGRHKPVEGPSRFRELRSLEVLLLRSRDNERAFAQQFRPRIIALVDHFLPVTHGVDRSTQPDRAQQVLGELAWMIDPLVEHRTPTLEEVDDLIDRLTNPPSTSTEEAA